MNDELTRPATRADFIAHAKDDHSFQEAQRKTNDSTRRSLGAIHKRLNEMPTKEQVASLATKEDAEQILAFIKTVRVGTGFFSFTFDNAAKIGSFLLLLLGIYAVLKYGVMGAIMWLSSNKVL